MQKRSQEELKSQNDSEEPVSCRHNRADAHVNSQTVSTFSTPSQVQALRGKVDRHGVPPLTKKLLSIDTHWPKAPVHHTRHYIVGQFEEQKSSVRITEIQEVHDLKDYRY